MAKEKVSRRILGLLKEVTHDDFGHMKADLEQTERRWRDRYGGLPGESGSAAFVPPQAIADLEELRAILSRRRRKDREKDFSEALNLISKLNRFLR